jgi:uncharacterized protein YdeI (YjbR/CyaY-like superfamily)
MAVPDPAVDAFLSRAPQWRAEMEALRAILLACGLEEALKWGKPCYAVDGKNVAIIQPFKAHCALMFFKGALLEDTHGLLRSQGPHSQAAKRLEFTSATAISAPKVKSYVKQAIAVEAAGRSVKASVAPRTLDLPDELAARLKKDRRLASAFAALTPGRQRAYAIHIAGAKQSATRDARIDTCAPRILAGRGLNDR